MTAFSVAPTDTTKQFGVRQSCTGVSGQAIADFMAGAFETNDPGFIAHALGIVARAKGMTQIASQTGLSREQLYRSFSAEGNPTLRTTLGLPRAALLSTARKPAI